MEKDSAGSLQDALEIAVAIRASLPDYSDVRFVVQEKNVVYRNQPYGQRTCGGRALAGPADTVSLSEVKGGVTRLVTLLQSLAANPPSGSLDEAHELARAILASLPECPDVRLVVQEDRVVYRNQPYGQRTCGGRALAGPADTVSLSEVKSGMKKLAEMIGALAR